MPLRSLCSVLTGHLLLLLSSSAKKHVMWSRVIWVIAPSNWAWVTWHVGHFTIFIKYTVRRCNIYLSSASSLGTKSNIWILWSVSFKLILTLGTSSMLFYFSKFWSFSLKTFLFLLLILFIESFNWLLDLVRKDL